MNDKKARPDRPLQPATLAAQALGWIEPATRGLAPAIQLATTFERDPDQSLPGGRSYIRPRAAAFEQPEALLAALEGGHAAMLFASGMAARQPHFKRCRRAIMPSRRKKPIGA